TRDQEEEDRPFRDGPLSMSTALASELAPRLRRTRCMDSGIAIQVRLTASVMCVLLLERFFELALHLLGGGGCAFFSAHGLSLVRRRRRPRGFIQAASAIDEQIDQRSEEDRDSNRYQHRDDRSAGKDRSDDRAHGGLI